MPRRSAIRPPNFPVVVHNCASRAEGLCAFNALNTGQKSMILMQSIDKGGQVRL